jgi:predicted phosphodiesterase
MKRAGFTYSLASNGLEALQAIATADAAGNSGVYDVVLVGHAHIIQFNCYVNNLS